MSDLPLLHQSFWVYVVVAAASIPLFTHCFNHKRRSLPYPPGPKPLPIVGNALDFPLSRPWETYARWGKQYGGITHVTALGYNIVVINAPEVASELLEGRSSIYSDRPEMPLAEMTGWYMTLATHHYGDMWRKHRTLYHQQFRQESIHRFRPLLTNKSHELLRLISKSPQEWSEHLSHCVAAIIMYVCYGYNIELKSDPLVEMAQTSAEEVAETIMKGSQIVNLIPITRHLPDWFPGFPRRARECRKKVNALMNVPYSSVRRHMANGDAVQSWLSELLQEHDSQGGDSDDEEIIKSVTASTFAASHDTTTAVLGFFVQAMVLFPEAQAKAQAEIDRVLGHGNLPSFEDRPNLPYLEALLLELLRWRPPTATGVPHALTQDDIYRGYFIPKGSIIFPNIWGMCHDPVAYPDPEAFLPERFLNKDGTVKADRPITFGFGRRICVGRAFALEIAWITIASILAVFNINEGTTVEGEEIKVSPDVTDTLILSPLPFKCAIAPRSKLCSNVVTDSPELKLDGIDLKWHYTM